MSSWLFVNQIRWSLSERERESLEGVGGRDFYFKDAERILCHIPHMLIEFWLNVKISYQSKNVLILSFNFLIFWVIVSFLNDTYRPPYFLNSLQILNYELICIYNCILLWNYELWTKYIPLLHVLDNFQLFCIEVNFCEWMK